jgi:sulfur-oxidizing protein SoxY
LQFDQISRQFISADFVRSIDVRYNGETLFSMDADISISEDPSITFDFIPERAGILDVQVRDSEGRRFGKTFELPSG